VKVVNARISRYNDCFFPSNSKLWNYSATFAIFSLLRGGSVTTYVSEHLIFYGGKLDLGLLPLSAAVRGVF